MKTYKFSKENWFFKFLYFANEKYPEDTCQIVWHTLGAVLKVGLVLVALAAIITIALGLIVVSGAVFCALVSLVPGMSWVLTEPLLSAWSILFCILGTAILVGFISLIVFLVNWKPKFKEKEPGPIKLAYHSFKDKTCSRIEVE